MNIIDGKKYANDIVENLKNTITQHNIKAKLTIFLWKHNESGHVYVKNKLKKAEYTGIETNLIEFDNISEDDLYKQIENEAKDPHNYIILQLPIPKEFNIQKLTNIIPSKQDIDGFCYDNVAKLSIGEEPDNTPATAKAIEFLINQYTNIEGKNVVIVGRSNIVGKPTYNLLLNKGATVRILHSKIKDIKPYTKQADILIVACGVPHLINKEYIKKDTIIIDVGINKKDGRIVGDVNFDDVKDIVDSITPVPGGVGPMTIAMLLTNIVVNELKYK